MSYCHTIFDVHVQPQQESGSGGHVPAESSAIPSEVSRHSGKQRFVASDETRKRFRFSQRRREILGKGAAPD
jgi:hypothetical protein